LDNDGDFDIISGDSGDNVYIWKNTLIHRNMPFDGGTTIGDVGADVVGIAIADLDNDGDPDIVSGDKGDNIYVWENDGTPWGTWTKYDIGNAGGDVCGLTVGDMDNDGWTDIVSGDIGKNVYVWENDGTPWGTWTGTDIGDGGNAVYSVAVADLDNDGWVDIVSGDTGKNVYVWENDGTPWGTWTGTDIGDAGGEVLGVESVDLDNDGWLDIVSGDSGKNVYVWENDGTPWGTWTGTDIGDTSGIIESVAACDLDNDGWPDIVSGDQGRDVHVWENDGTPWGTWTKTDIGDAGHQVYTVTAGDLDNDGLLDIVSGDLGANVYVWENDGTPFEGSWTGTDLGNAGGGVDCVAVGDLDSDGDLDIISGDQGDDVRIWQNTGGSTGYTVTSTAPSSMRSSVKDDVLKIKVEHNGISGDNDLEITKWKFLFEETDEDPLTTTEAKSVFNNLYIYLDDGDGTWESGEDTVVKTVSNTGISLVGGVQEFVFTDGDTNLQISKATRSRTYFLVVEMKSDAETKGDVVSFRVTFDPDADTLNEDRTEDTTISVQGSSETNTRDVKVPEFHTYILPLIAPLALLIYFRRKRKGGGRRV